jgi:hypothetical protein
LAKFNDETAAVQVATLMADGRPERIKKTAEKIASALGKRGHHPVWWNAIESGDFTLERILAITRWFERWVPGESCGQRR